MSNTVPSLPVLAPGSRVLINDPELFDSLYRAGLLAQIGTDQNLSGITWPVWGIDHYDEAGNLFTECQLKRSTEV